MLYRKKEISAADGLIPAEKESGISLIARPSLARARARHRRIYASPINGVNAVLKRIFDIIFASVAIFILSPVLLAISLLVKLTSSGPILFKQNRHGLYGEEIAVWKFRSMSVMEDGKVVTQAKKNDSRITTIGKVLRQTSLDELPQFFNVLRGSMTVVGPRPHAVAHNKYYRGKIDNYMRRHVVKPGITGWAQINGARGETETIDKMQMRVDLDLEYIKNWTLWLDIRIVLITVFRGFINNNA